LQTTPASGFTTTEDYRLLNATLQAACAIGIRRCGEELNKKTGGKGLNIMRAVCQHAADRDPDNANHRSQTIDYSWDGIGHWRA
jgi:hypothetical protein